jgi:hypothetical protein
MYVCSNTDNTQYTLPFLFVFPPRILGHPAAKILHVYNPSRENEVVVNSVFTAARHFHVPPVHCRVSVDVLWKPHCGRLPGALAFFGLEI